MAGSDDYEVLYIRLSENERKRNRAGVTLRIERRQGNTKNNGVLTSINQTQ